MPLSIRPYRRFPVCCPVTYHAGLCEGQGIVWNLSVNGWRLSGDVPLRVGQTCFLTVHLPNQLTTPQCGQAIPPAQTTLSRNAKALASSWKWGDDRTDRKSVV